MPSSQGAGSYRSDARYQSNNEKDTTWWSSKDGQRMQYNTRQAYLRECEEFQAKYGGETDPWDKSDPWSQRASNQRGSSSSWWDGVWEDDGGYGLG